MAKVIVVSGGTFGLGRGVVLGLARAGFNVVAFGIDSKQPASTAQNTLQSMRDECSLEGLNVTVLEGDVSSEADVGMVIDAAMEKYGRLDAVVNNAAIGPLGTVLDTAPELWDRIMQVNLKGPYLLARQSVPLMAAQGGGSIINIGSGAGWGKPNMAAYAASKGGLIALGAALALDHFSQKIRVNTVIPGGGGIDAGMTHGRLNDVGKTFPTDAIGSVAGRPVEGRDMMAVIKFLVSEEAEAISGTVIDVGCFARQGSSTPTRVSS